LLIAAIKDIGKRVGIQIKRYDFSEPQQGKDICDRIICPQRSELIAMKETMLSMLSRCWKL
jgi:hypothetical protein